MLIRPGSMSESAERVRDRTHTTRSTECSVLRFLITVTYLGSMPRRGILSIAVGFNLRKREECTSTWTLKGSTIWEGCVLSQHNGPSGAPLAQMGSGLVDPFRVVPNYWAGDRAHGLKTVAIQSAPLQGECRISLRPETITNQRWPVHGHCTIRDSIYEIVCSVLYLASSVSYATAKRRHCRASRQCHPGIVPL